MIEESCLQQAWLQGLHSAWRQHGIDAERLFEQAGIVNCLAEGLAPDELSDRMSFLWELAVASSGDPSLGLKTARLQPLGSLGFMAHLILASPTLRGALEHVCEYTGLVLPTAMARIETPTHDTLRVCLHIKGGQRAVPTQRYDFVAGLTVHLMSWVLGQPVLPMRVRSCYPAPRDLAMHAETFRCPLEFNETECSLDFRREDLASPLPTANPLVADWCAQQANDIIRSRRGHMATRVKKLLLQMLPKGDPRRDEVASLLCMSERTLQRRLAEEGTYFQGLVDQTRRDLAQQLLKVGRLTPKEMSFELGFSDPSNFYRACRRWFGQSPREFRASLE